MAGRGGTSWLVHRRATGRALQGGSGRESVARPGGRTCVVLGPRRAGAIVQTAALANGRGKPSWGSSLPPRAVAAPRGPLRECWCRGASEARGVTRPMLRGTLHLAAAASRRAAWTRCVRRSTCTVASAPRVCVSRAKMILRVARGGGDGARPGPLAWALLAGRTAQRRSALRAGCGESERCGCPAHAGAPAPRPVPRRATRRRPTGHHVDVGGLCLLTVTHRSPPLPSSPLPSWSQKLHLQKEGGARPAASARLGVAESVL